MTHRPPRPVSLWSIIESLQRRLEDQGLAGDAIDVAVVSTLARALAGPPRV